MTQEDKDLLLKDLVGRLPYGVKVQMPIWDYNDKMTTEEDATLYSVNTYGYCETVEYDAKISVEEITPYLFPLSSMTEEQKKDIFHNGKFYIDHHNSICRFPRYDDDYDFVTMEDYLEIFNKLNKYHFDYRGLIPMGLANDATGLNIY